MRYPHFLNVGIYRVPKCLTGSARCRRTRRNCSVGQQEDPESFIPTVEAGPSVIAPLLLICTCISLKVLLLSVINVSCLIKKTLSDKRRPENLLFRGKAVERKARRLVHGSGGRRQGLNCRPNAEVPQCGPVLGRNPSNALGIEYKSLMNKCSEV